MVGRSLALAVSTLFAVTMLARSAPADGRGPLAQAQPDKADKDVATADEARARCGVACHAFPPPEILPRAAWRDELVRMMLIQEGIPEPAGSGGVIPLPPDWIRLQRYFEQHAPEALPEPEPWPPIEARDVRFSRRVLAPIDPTVAAAIANARFFDLDGDRRPDVVASDMRTGAILAGLARQNFELVTIARLAHPSHIEQVDLDRDGLQDLLVADLGSFQPADHARGAVYWLRRTRAGGFETVRLLSGLPRVADVRAADLDGDRDLDLVVAAFGWRTTGHVAVYLNQTSTWRTLVFTPKVIDARTGAIHAPIADLDGDGRPDVVAVLAQQHETVVFYRNTGRALEFTPTTVYAAPHPNWGSSGLELVDLDRDGDLDVLLTHGDTFDDFVLKPYHGIQWLENRGTFPFTAHTLATLPGAQRAQAVDLDGDGDLDVVASAMIAGGALNPTLASLVWLEQVRRGVFVRHTLEMGSPYHATLDLADINGDGRPDILVGWLAFGRPLPSWLDLWTSTAR